MCLCCVWCYLMVPAERCPYDPPVEELERELLSIVTREVGEVRIMACRSKLGSDRQGELVRGRFLLGLAVSLGLGNREPKRDTYREEREVINSKLCIKMLMVSQLVQKYIWSPKMHFVFPIILYKDIKLYSSQSAFIYYRSFKGAFTIKKRNEIPTNTCQLDILSCQPSTNKSPSFS